jgi:hypothetical protein
MGLRKTEPEHHKMGLVKQAFMPAQKDVVEDRRCIV